MKSGCLGCAGVVGVFIIVGILASISLPEYESSYATKEEVHKTLNPPDPVFTSEEIANLEDFEKAALDLGVVKRFDPASLEVYVDPVAWEMSNVDNKEMLISLCSQYCAWKGEYPFKTTDVEIRSFQSGKTLAAYSKLSGIKYY